MLSSRVYLWLTRVLIVYIVYVPQRLSLSFSLGECEVSPGSDVSLSMIRAGVWTHCVSDQKISLPALQIWQLFEGESRVLLAWVYCLVRVFGMRCESKTAVFAVAIWGILGIEIEWYWSMAIGAMYAGTFLGPTVFHYIAARERHARFRFGFWFLILLLNWSWCWSWTISTGRDWRWVPLIVACYLGCTTAGCGWAQFDLRKSCVWSPLGARVKEVGEGAPLWREGSPALPRVGTVQSGTNTSAVLISVKSRGLNWETSHHCVQALFLSGERT